MVKKNMLIQSVIFKRDKYSKKCMVRKWLRENELKPLKKGCKAIDTTQQYHRVRIRDPWRFNKNSFRTVTKNKNLKIIMGKLK